MSEKFEKEIIERLDLVVKLLSRMNLSKDATQTEAIIQLSRIGLRPSQIADTLNTSQNYVNLILSKNRSDGKKNG
jgi:orotate phosphoribosyltransferase-like protein